MSKSSLWTPRFILSSSVVIVPPFGTLESFSLPNLSSFPYSEVYAHISTLDSIIKYPQQHDRTYALVHTVKILSP